MQPFGRNRYGPKIWGCCAPLGEGELDPHLIQCGQAEAYLHAKFHLDLSNHLATVHERHRETGQDRQRSDSIGRTVLQTVTQKPFWILMKQEMIGWQWRQLHDMQITAPRSRQITMPLNFYMLDALPNPNQQCQSTEGNLVLE